MTVPTDPPEWALSEARDLIYRVLEIGGGWETSEQLVALALATARRRGIEEAARAASSAKLPEHYRWGHDAMEQFTFGLRRAVEAIYVLTSKEPT